MFPLDVSTASPVPLLLFVAALPVVARPKKQRTLNCFNQDPALIIPLKIHMTVLKNHHFHEDVSLYLLHVEATCYSMPAF